MLQKHSKIKKLLFLLPLLLSFSTVSAKDQTPDYIKYYNEGVVAQRNNDYSAAIDHYKDALDEKADFSDAWSNLGYCYRMSAQNYLAQSGEAYNKALGYDPMHEGALEYQGELFLMLGELNKAYDNYKALKNMKSGDARELKEAMDPILKQARDILKNYTP